MHLNVSGPCGHFGNRPAAAANGARDYGMRPVQIGRRTAGAIRLRSPLLKSHLPANPRAAVGNYTPVTRENPCYCWEAAPLCLPCGRSSAGRAPPCQGGCREFESRRPLARHCQGKSSSESCLHGGLAERRGSGLQSRIHGFESRTHLGENHVFQRLLDAWAIGAAVARFPDTEEVTGSIPVSPTRTRQLVCC
jgi:hypothetical protein